VMVVECTKAIDMFVALGGVVGAEEVELYLGQSFNEEGLAAAIGTSIDFLPRV